jgi:hypothetical protein
VPVDLPVVHLPVEGEPELSRDDAVSFEELATLADLGPSEAVTEIHVNLPRQRWAVGRVGPDGGIWRVGEPGDRDRLGHPAWLWTDDVAFAPGSGESTPVPLNLPLRTLIRQSSALAGSVRGTCDALAATIAQLRKRKKPVCVVGPVDRQPLQPETGNPARWFALAVLTCLPPNWRRRLRVSTHAADPKPEQWDLVFAPKAPAGFAVVDVTAVASVDDDVVASYLLDRLLGKDPEAVEAAAYLAAGEGDDPWGEGVRAHLAGGVPGFTSVEATQLQFDPESAVQAILRRLDAGAELKGAVVAELAAVTSKTWDPRPWAAVAARPEADREHAVRSVLPHLDPVAVPASFVDSVVALGRIGAAVGPWAAFLVRVLREGQDAAAPAAEALEEIVANDGIDGPTRASIWQEVVLARIEAGDEAGLLHAITSAASRRVAAEGAGSVLVHAFLALPSHQRTQNLLRSLVDAITAGVNPDLAMASLYRGLLADHSELTGGDMRAAAVGRVVLQHWARVRTSSMPPAIERDRLLALVRNTPAAIDWAEIVSPLAPWERVKALILPVMPADAAQAARVWVAAENARAARLGGTARDRLVQLSAFLPEGGPALEPLARELVAEIAADPRFPDADLSDVAAGFAELGASPLWMLLAITAGPNGTYGEDDLDGTTIAFCESPPRTRPERVVAAKCVEALAAADGWAPHDFARWFVRLAMAPDGDGSGLNAELAEALVRGIVARDADGIRILVDLTRGLLQLDAHHPATQLLLARLPSIFGDGLPRQYVDAVEVSALPDDALERWRLALDLA